MTRLIIRAGLFTSFVIAVVVAFYVVQIFGLKSSETWLLIAADLAVLTSIMSTWSSQRVLELEEDAKEPDVHFEFDPYSRYFLLQFRVKNIGGSAALDIRFSLDRLISKQPSGILKFGNLEAGSEIPILGPGESIGQAVGTLSWFFQNYEDATFKGKVQFRNVSGKKRVKEFLVSAEQFRESLAHETEMVKAYRDIQDIPNVLKEISRKLDRFPE